MEEEKVKNGRKIALAKENNDFSSFFSTSVELKKRLSEITNRHLKCQNLLRELFSSSSHHLYFFS